MVRGEGSMHCSIHLQMWASLPASAVLQCVAFEKFEYEVGHIAERAHDESRSSVDDDVGEGLDLVCNTVGGTEMIE